MSHTISSSFFQGLGRLFHATNNDYFSDQAARLGDYLSLTLGNTQKKITATVKSSIHNKIVIPADRVFSSIARQVHDRAITPAYNGVFYVAQGVENKLLHPVYNRIYSSAQTSGQVYRALKRVFTELNKDTVASDEKIGQLYRSTLLAAAGTSIANAYIINKIAYNTLLTAFRTSCWSLTCEGIASALHIYRNHLPYGVNSMQMCFAASGTLQGLLTLSRSISAGSVAQLLTFVASTLSLVYAGNETALFYLKKEILSELGDSPELRAAIRQMPKLEFVSVCVNNIILSLAIKMMAKMPMLTDARRDPEIFELLEASRNQANLVRLASLRKAFGLGEEVNLDPQQEAPFLLNANHQQFDNVDELANNADELANEPAHPYVVRAIDLKNYSVAQSLFMDLFRVHAYATGREYVIKALRPETKVIAPALPFLASALTAPLQLPLVAAAAACRNPNEHVNSEQTSRKLNAIKNNIKQNGIGSSTIKELEDVIGKEFVEDQKSLPVRILRAVIPIISSCSEFLNTYLPLSSIEKKHPTVQITDPARLLIATGVTAVAQIILGDFTTFLGGDRLLKYRTISLLSSPIRWALWLIPYGFILARFASFQLPQLKVKAEEVLRQFTGTPPNS